MKQWKVLLLAVFLFGVQFSFAQEPAAPVEEISDDFIYEEEPLTRLEQAEEKFVKKEWPSAIELYQKIVETPADKSEYEQGLFGLARSYENLGDVKKAVHYYNAVARQGVTEDLKEKSRQRVRHFESYVIGQIHFGKWYPKLWLHGKTEALAQKHPDYAWQARVGIPYLLLIGFKLICLFLFAGLLIAFSSSAAQGAPGRFDIRWGVPSVIAIYLIFLVLQMFVVHLLKPDLSGGENEFIYQLFELILSYLILLALVLFLLTWREIPWRKLGIDIGNMAGNLVMAAKYIVIIGIFFGLLAFLRYHGFIEQGKVIRSYPAASIGSVLLGMQVFLLVVVSPIAEEIFYRGFIYPVARNKTGLLGGIFLTSLFFAVVHVDLKSLFLLFGLSMLLCYLYEKSRNLIPAICVHAFYNFLMLFGGSFLPNPPS